MPLTCPDCAKLIQPTWRHGPHCGQPLAVGATPPRRPAAPLPAWCLPLAALLALVAVTLLVVLHGAPLPPPAAGWTSLTRVRG
jgi:hypothetical protein